MNERAKILNASKNEFRDNQNNATVTLSNYFNSKNGLAYILLGKTKINVSIAIYLSAQQEQSAEGNLDKGEVTITSQTELYKLFDTVGDIFVIDYKDLKIVINRSYQYNETARTYHYTGEVLQARNQQFLITDDNIEEYFLSNSTAKWLEFGKMYGYRVFPAFLTPVNLTETYFTVEILSTQALSGISMPESKKLNQFLKDKVRVMVTNGSLDISQKFLYNVVEQAERNQFFGIMNFGNWEQSHDELQRGFSIKANINVMELDINYYVDSNIDEVLKYIRYASINLKPSEV